MLNNKNPFCVDSNLYPALRQAHSINVINGTLFLIQKYAIESRHHQLILNDWVSETDVRINSF